MGTLADKVRAKYPGAYDDLSDAALEAKITAKFPGVYDDLVTPKEPLRQALPPENGYIEVNADGSDSMSAAEKLNNPYFGIDTPEKLREEIKLSNYIPSRKTIADFVRPTLEGVGMGLGGAAGVAAAPETLGLSVPAGAAMGYAGGKGIADLIEGTPAKADLLRQFAATGNDVYTGAKMEATGMGLGGLVGTGINKIRNARIPLTAAATRRNTAQAFRDIQTASDAELAGVYAANRAEADALQKRVNSSAPLTPAQMTGNVRAGFTEQSLAAKDARLAEALKQQDSSNIGAAVDNMTETLGTAQPMPIVRDAITIGETQRGALQAGRDASKAEVSAAYRTVPEYPMPTDSFIKTAQGLDQEYLHPEAQDAIQTALKVFQSKPPTTRSLIAFDQYLSDEIRQASKQGNDRVAKVLGILKRGTEDGSLQGLKGDFTTMGEAAQAGDIAISEGKLVRPSQIQAELEQVNQAIVAPEGGGILASSDAQALAARKSELESQIADLQPAEDVAATYGEAHDKALAHFKKYGTDTVKKVLAPGDHIGGGRVAPETVPARLFTQSGARELVNTIGADQAAAQMKPHVTNLLVTGRAINADGTLNIQKAVAVVRANRVALNTLGLTDHAHDIIKGQIPATIRAELEAKGIDIMGNPVMGVNTAAKWVRSYAPALRAIYGDSSREILAMQDYASMVRILSRNKNVSYSGGSTTIEKMLMDAPKASFAGKTYDNLLVVLGSVLGGAATGGLGGLGGGYVAGKAGQAVMLAAKQQQQQIAGELFRDAITNPTTARMLMDIGKGRKVTQMAVHSAIKTLAGYTLARPDTGNDE